MRGNATEAPPGNYRDARPISSWRPWSKPASEFLLKTEIPNGMREMDDRRPLG
jgi:hypothetical protein